MKNAITLLASLILLSGCASTATEGGSDDAQTPPADSVSTDTAVSVEDVSVSDNGVQDTSTSDVEAEDTHSEDTQAEDTQAEDTQAEDTTETDTSTQIELPDEKPPIDKTYDMFIGDWLMPPGQEVTKCTLKRLGNVDPIFVTGIKSILAQGSHHLIIYKSNETEEQAEPFDCIPFTEGLTGGTFPLMISQKPEEHLEFPNGIAIQLEANQMIRIESHFLNYFPEEITAHADIVFETIKEEDVVSEANMLFYGSPDFTVKPNQETQTPWFHLSQWADTNVFALTGHTHQLGINVEVYKTSGPEDDGNEIYPLDQEFVWSESPVIQYDPPLNFGEGDGFRYRCTWNNPTNKSVGFGESANAEMCFFWAYYYPSQGYRMCINAGEYGANFGIDQICCPGSPLCGLVTDFL